MWPVTAGLPGLPCEGGVPATQSETPVPGTHHLLCAASPSPEEEPDHGLPARNEPASNSCRGNIRIIGPVGMVEIAAEGTVEGPVLQKPGMGCEAFMASIDHNLLKALRRPGCRAGPLGPGAPTDRGIPASLHLAFLIHPRTPLNVFVHPDWNPALLLHDFRTGSKLFQQAVYLAVDTPRQQHLVDP